MAVAELTLVPIGTCDTSCSAYVANALDVLSEFEDLKYELNPMGTVISGNLENIYRAIAKMQESVFENGAQRVYTVIKIDDRRDKTYSFKDKIDSVNKKRKS